MIDRPENLANDSDPAEKEPDSAAQAASTPDAEAPDAKAPEVSAPVSDGNTVAPEPAASEPAAPEPAAPEILVPSDSVAASAPAVPSQSSPERETVPQGQLQQQNTLPLPASYGPPVPGVIPPAFGHTPAPDTGYNPYTNAPTSEKTPTERARRTTTVGLIAALAVGALVGGVSGAGVVAAVMSSNQNTSSSANATPANITVNDAADATLITAVAASAGPSVVTISVTDGAGSGGTGSGVILSDDGYVLTNAHVVTLDGATATPRVSVQTDTGALFEASVVGVDPISDLAVIKIDGGSDFQAASFADSSKLNVGDIAIAIGAPLGLSNTVTTGVVSSLNRSITVASSAAPDSSAEEVPQPNDPNQGPFDFWQFDNAPGNGARTTATSTIALTVIQTDAAINPGNSGGALLDTSGNVIGINVAIASTGGSATASTAGSIGVGFAIPANLAQRIATEIIETGTGTHGLLGAAVSDATIENSTTVGALIEEISPAGAAQAGGLRTGDVVTAINGLPVTGKTDLTAQVRALAAGSDADITYQRRGQSGTVSVTLGSMN